MQHSPAAEPLILEFAVEPYLHGVRIDSFLVKHFRNYTAWRMQRMVRAGQVAIDGEKADPARRVCCGQQVRIRLIEPPDKLIAPEPIPFGVVAEDRWLLVADKPPGMIVHPTGGNTSGTLANAVQEHLDRQSARRGLLRPGIVHRLDQDTSGVVAVAKDHLSHRRLSIEFQAERVSKAYLALVTGNVRGDRGQIDLPIGRLRGASSALTTTRGDALDARRARTLFEVVERLSDHTLLRVVPRTGRLHQIRVHLAAIGHPVVGDEFYDERGAIPAGRPRPASPLIGRQALHAEKLAFQHPLTRVWSEFTVPLPPDMRTAIERARRA